MLEAMLDNLLQTIKIDISTGDIITPDAVEYSYNLMFENRTISLWTYNLETLLAEKLETMIARSIANTRIRDFYDIYIISQKESIDLEILKKAFLAVSKKRNTLDKISDFNNILDSIETNDTMKQLWNNYCYNSFFIEELTWEEIIASVKSLAEKVL